MSIYVVNTIREYIFTKEILCLASMRPSAIGFSGLGRSGAVETEVFIREPHMYCLKRTSKIISFFTRTNYLELSSSEGVPGLVLFASDVNTFVDICYSRQET